MFDIEMRGMSEDFFACWKAAAHYIDRKREGEDFVWLRLDPRPPFLEHFSFQLGNQVFFVRVVDVNRQIEGPGSFRGLHSIADGCKGYACLMPMQKNNAGDWTPVEKG